MYYADKLESLKDLFGTKEIILNDNFMVVDGRSFPILDDVIVILDPSQYPSKLKKRLKLFDNTMTIQTPNFAEDIQFTFGEEWQKFHKILPEHEQEFSKYFDLIELPDLKDYRVCDLGSGIGRWSYFLNNKCRELVLVDFSEAIFVARRNLRHISNALFFMGDLKLLPFRNDFADFLFCLGVLHHLPSNALDEVRALKKFAPTLLIYLYYNLDKRPIYFHILLSIVTVLRKLFSKISNPIFRSSFTWLIATGIYLPFIWLGKALKPVGLSQYIPLAKEYNGKSMERIRQDVYDRFFTRIEQRYSKKQIMELKDTFSRIIISERLPYWHFICER